MAGRIRFVMSHDQTWLGASAMEARAGQAQSRTGRAELPAAERPGRLGVHQDASRSGIARPNSIARQKMKPSGGARGRAGPPSGPRRRQRRAAGARRSQDRADAAGAASSTSRIRSLSAVENVRRRGRRQSSGEVAAARVFSKEITGMTMGGCNLRPQA